jgi:hypothetical protein
MNKQQLAGGVITVWLDGDETIIHHANGLTLALTAEETRQLRVWIEEQDRDWEERAELENLQRMEREDAGIRIPPGHSVSSALQSKL